MIQPKALKDLKNLKENKLDKSSHSWDALQNKPTFHDCATSGDADTVNGKTVLSNVPANAKFTDTTYSAATTSANGLMSASDKTKLNGIAAGATANVVVNALNSTSTTSCLSAYQGKVLNDEITNLKSTVVNGKQSVANAINDNFGTSLSNQSTFDELANAISGGAGLTKLFDQTFVCEDTTISTNSPYSYITFCDISNIPVSVLEKNSIALFTLGKELNFYYGEMQYSTKLISDNPIFTSSVIMSTGTSTAMARQTGCATLNTDFFGNPPLFDKKNFPKTLKLYGRNSKYSSGTFRPTVRIRIYTSDLFNETCIDFK